MLDHPVLGPAEKRKALGRKIRVVPASICRFGGIQLSLHPRLLFDALCQEYDGNSAVSFHVLPRHDSKAFLRDRGLEVVYRVSG